MSTNLSTNIPFGEPNENSNTGNGANYNYGATSQYYQSTAEVKPEMSASGSGISNNAPDACGGNNRNPVLGFTPSGKPRLYQCSVCLRSFARLEHLKRHERSHTKEKPFNCGVCGRKFSRRDLLLRHAEKLHGGCAEAVKRLRRRRRSAVKKDDKLEYDVDDEYDDSKEAVPSTILEAGPPMSTFTSPGYLKGRSDRDNGSSLFNNFVSKHEDAEDLRDAKRIRRASFSASSGENYAMPKFENFLAGNSNGHFNGNPNASGAQMGLGPNYFNAGSVEFSTPQFGANTSMKLQNIREMSLNSAKDDANIKKINNFVSDLNLNSESPGATMDVDKKDSQLYGDYNIYGVESPDAEDWVNKVLENSQIEFLSNLKHKKSSGITRKINHYQNQLNKVSSNDSTPYNTNVKNSPDAGPKDASLNGYSFYTDEQEVNLASQSNKRSMDTRNFDSFENQFEVKKEVSGDKSQELSKEYDLLSELNNLQNFQFLLQDGVKNSLVEMDRNDSSKSTNSTQTMVSSNSEPLVKTGNLAAKGTPYFQHFNNISNGYSYYGVNVPMLQSNSDNSSIIQSPIRNISPIMLDSNNSNVFPSRYQSQQMSQQPSQQNHTSNFPPQAAQPTSPKILFTKYLRSRIYKTLLKYPFIGIPSPTIVDNNKLNEYVDVFADKFLNHLPFIHEFFLNETNMYKLTSYYWEEGTSQQEPIMEDEKDAAAVCLPLLIATSGAIVSNNKREASNLYEASRRCIHVYLDSRKKNHLTPSNSSPLWLIQSLTLSVIYGLFAEFDLSSEIILKQVNALIALIRSSNLNKLKFSCANSQDKTEKYLIYQCKLRTVFTVFNISNLLTYFYGLKIDKIFSITEIDLNLPEYEINYKLMKFKGLNESAKENKENNFQVILKKLLNQESIDVKISEYGLVSLQLGLNQYLSENNDVELLKNWNNNFIKQVPIYMNKNHENFYNNSSNLLKLDSLILNYYLIFKHFSNGYVELSKIKSNGVWGRNWKLIGDVLLRNQEDPATSLSAVDPSLQAVKFGLKIVIDLFFIKDFNSSFSYNNTNTISITEDDDSLFEFGIIDNMITKDSISKILSLNLQLLFDVCLVLCKFGYDFETYCNSVDPNIIKSIELEKIENEYPAMKNTHGLKLLLGYNNNMGISNLLSNKRFLKKLRYYKLILTIFNKLENFCVVNYNFNNGSKLLKKYKNQYNWLEINQKYKVSLKVLQVAEFMFDVIFDQEIGFNIFQNLGQGIYQLYVYLVGVIRNEEAALAK